MSGTPVSLSFVTSLINGSRNKNQDLKKILCDYLESNKDQNVSDLYNKVKGFEAEFSNWSSGNQIIDKFIQEIQLNATEWAQYLEWIPYERLVNVHYLAKGGFGSVYSATWLDGPKACDRDKIEIFCRKENHPVALKSINHSGPAMEGFFSELNIYIEAMKSFDGYNDLLRYYGITQNPETKEYMMVTQFANQE
ncbi:18964_t:CDS:2 [Entrophospora sp. SA101]|nr:18964_t:CDS:2 [Entrophospora sp. SA101]